MPQTVEQIRRLNPKRLRELIRMKKNRKEIAELCGISKSTLLKRTKEYGITK